MKIFITMFLIFMTVMILYPLFALADGVPPDPGSMITQIFGYFKGGQWILGVMTVIMLMTHVINNIAFIAKWIPDNVKPWVSAGLGVLLCVFTGLSVGIPWWQAIIAGLFTGTAASGLWSLVGKHLLKSDADKEKKAELKTVKLALKDGALAVDKESGGLVLKLPDWVKDKPKSKGDTDPTSPG